MNPIGHMTQKQKNSSDVKIENRRNEDEFFIRNLFDC
jgi:hypothetical protein